MISIVGNKKNVEMLRLQALVLGGHSERGEHRTPIGAAAHLEAHSTIHLSTLTACAFCRKQRSDFHLENRQELSQ